MLDIDRDRHIDRYVCRKIMANPAECAKWDDHIAKNLEERFFGTKTDVDVTGIKDPELEILIFVYRDRGFSVEYKEDEVQIENEKTLEPENKKRQLLLFRDPKRYKCSGNRQSQQSNRNGM